MYICDCFDNKKKAGKVTKRGGSIFREGGEKRGHLRGIEALV